MSNIFFGETGCHFIIKIFLKNTVASSPLSDISFTNILSQSVTCTFIFLMVSSEIQRVFMPTIVLFVLYEADLKQ